MQWFIDTDCHKTGQAINLISIALVSSDDREYYAVAQDGWSPETCSDLIKKNVLPWLPPRGSNSWKTRRKITRDLTVLLTDIKRPEFWGYLSSYDWVALCQLYDCADNLPEWFPKYCLDLKQEMRRTGLKKRHLPYLWSIKQKSRNALDRAKWNRRLYRYLTARTEKDTKTSTAKEHPKGLLGKEETELCIWIGKNYPSVRVTRLDETEIEGDIAENIIDIFRGLHDVGCGQYSIEDLEFDAQDHSAIWKAVRDEDSQWCSQEFVVGVIVSELTKQGLVLHTISKNIQTHC